MGSIFSAIGRGINAIIGAIANVIMTIVSVITTVRISLFSSLSLFSRPRRSSSQSSTLSWTSSAVDASARAAADAGQAAQGASEVAPRGEQEESKYLIFNPPIFLFSSYFASLSTFLSTTIRTSHFHLSRLTIETRR
ncbi:hypothetical protein CCMSSC00406_0002925 [Pleurotus cornucopiae]|uniref:Uncharacterized protein n=1 Tax=Pleurotus cornucopiae TaxID=5321 RepID=A0ACB7J4N3_PLECO|nr:hypothetical protein CCMSSC00406_0002925 [Pleurotus cornucopiae]